MNIDELLREQGEQWQAPDAGEPDLGAALGRRGRRVRAVGIGTGVIAVVAALVIGGGGWAGGGDDVPAAPAPVATPTAGPTGTGSAPVTTGAPTPTAGTTTDVPLDRIAKVAVKVVDKLSLATPPATAEVVGTTLGEVFRNVPVRGHRKVWLVQAAGSFTCGEPPHCARASSPASGPVLRVILFQADLSVFDWGTFDDTTDLADLGPVFGVDLDAAR